MANTSTPEELATHLAAQQNDKLVWLIGVDGKDGAGKSVLAKNLSHLLSAKLVSVDDFLEKNRGSYVESLKLDELADAIHDTRGPVIIEGVCLLAVVERIGVELNELVYVKRTRHGLWVDEDTCNSIKTADEIIEKEKGDLFAFLEWEASQEEKNPPTEGDTRLSALTEEIIRYHAKHKPSELASHTYEVKHA